MPHSHRRLVQPHMRFGSCKMLHEEEFFWGVWLDHNCTACMFILGRLCPGLVSHHVALHKAQGNDECSGALLQSAFHLNAKQVRGRNQSWVNTLDETPQNFSEGRLTYEQLVASQWLSSTKAQVDPSAILLIIKVLLMPLFIAVAASSSSLISGT